MKRWFNYRPIFVSFAFLLLGSLFSFYILKAKILTIVLTSVLFVFVILFSIFRRRIDYLLVPVLSFVIACSVFNISINNFNKFEVSNPTTISARVYSVSSTSNGVVRIKGDSCCFDNKEINTNISILIYDETNIFKDIEIGSLINFKPLKFYKSDLFYNSEIPNSKMFAENLKYTATCNIDELSVTGFDKTFAEKIKHKIKENLGGNLTNENVELAYSTLFGEKEFLNDSQYSAYKLSGIAHLLAVSGLHVSIIVAILSKLMALVKIKGFPKLIIISILLGFYAYLCGFSVSVIRAGVMSIILLLSEILGREYDPLTALGFAGIIIFFINPLCIFDISFLMSFACIFGIIIFSKFFKHIFESIKVPKKISDALAISAATLLSLIFISAYFFHNFNLISLLANIIIIPIFTVAFSLVFITSFISLLIPAVCVVLNPLNMCLILLMLLQQFWVIYVLQILLQLRYSL